MPERISSEQIGSGMTAYTRQRAEYDWPLTNKEAEHLDSFFDSCQAPDPIYRAREAAEATLKIIEADAPDPSDFEPYAGMGWYSREIITRCTWLAEAGADDDRARRERWACEIGIIWSEATLKKSCDGDVEAGRRHLATREAVNGNNRLASHAQRQAIVREILYERDRGVDDACAEATKRFAHMGKASTFRTSYFKKIVEG